MGAPERHLGDADRGQNRGVSAQGESVDSPEFESIARRYLLLPHERLVAKRRFQRRYSPSGAWIGPGRDTNGPVGVAMLGVLQAWFIPGWLLGMSGIGLLFASDGAASAYWVGYVGVAMIAIGIMRVLPALPAYNRWQAEHSLAPPPGQRH
jgi:hypothetical protein